jgi:hypothetical protein
MFLVFVCRTQRQLDQGKPLLDLHYTEGQQTCIRRIWQQVEDVEYGRSWEELLLACVRKMWRGSSEEDFYYLVTDKWSEPTLVFGLLNCLAPNGKFVPPRECSRYFNRIKYCMRLMLLTWCIKKSLEVAGPVGW